MKRVIYNGKKDTYRGCSNPANLVPGKEYDVLFEDVGRWQTNYILKGIPGSYNAVWFNVIKDDSNIKQVNAKNTSKGIPAIAREVPKVGYSYHCKKVEMQNGICRLIGWRTSTVRAVEEIARDLYKVTTRNNVYNVSVSSFY